MIIPVKVANDIDFIKASVIDVGFKKQRLGLVSINEAGLVGL